MKSYAEILAKENNSSIRKQKKTHVKLVKSASVEDKIEVSIITLYLIANASWTRWLTLVRAHAAIVSTAILSTGLYTKSTKKQRLSW